MDDVRLIWCAGFFDGEGCVRAQGNQLHVRVSQRERRPLEVFLDLFGGGSIYENPGTRFGRTYVQLHWCATSSFAGKVLELMLPYLVVKHEQAVLGIEFAHTYGVNGSRMSTSTRNRREEICQQLKVLKKSGE